MANVLTVNPMRLTTVMATSYKAQVAASLGALSTLRIEKIYWEKSTNTGDTLRINDPNSGTVLAEIISVQGGASYWIDWTAAPKMWADFIVSQLDSGTLFIYTR